MPGTSLGRVLGSDLELAARRHEGGKAGDGEADLVFPRLGMDHFKSVKDSHGHAAGGAVLAQVAALLRSVFRAWQEIVGIADHGLYAAKRKGRNGWVGLEAGDTEDLRGGQGLTVAAYPFRVVRDP